MNQKEYNGWYNYETWSCNLWLENDEGSSDYLSDQARDCYKMASESKHRTRKEDAQYKLADILKDEIETGAESALKETSTLYADLLNAAISEINFDEIANHFIDSISDEIDEDEKESE